jgi:hypothetical protein
MSSRAWFGVDFKQQLLEKKFTLIFLWEQLDLLQWLH